MGRVVGVRILVVSSQLIQSPPPGYGGLEYVAFTVAYRLAQLGHSVSLLARMGSEGSAHYLFNLMNVDDSDVDKIKYYEFDAASAVGDAAGLEAMAAKSLQSSVSMDEFDAVIDESWSKALSVNRRNAIGVLHSPKHYGNWGIKLFAVSRFHKNYVEATYGEVSGVLYNSIVEELYKRSSSKDDFYLFISRVSQEKGLTVFMRACVEGGFKCVVAGDDGVFAPDRGFVSASRDFAARHGIKWLGQVPFDVKVDLMSAAKAVVVMPQPPYVEVFGLWGIEAMQCGTPIVTNLNGAMYELAGRTSKEGGLIMGRGSVFTIDPFSSHDLARAMGLVDSLQKRVTNPVNSKVVAAQHLKELQSLLYEGDSA